MVRSRSIVTWNSLWYRYTCRWWTVCFWGVLSLNASVIYCIYLP